MSITHPIHLLGESNVWNCLHFTKFIVHFMWAPPRKTAIKSTCFTQIIICYFSCNLDPCIRYWCDRVCFLHIFRSLQRPTGWCLKINWVRAMDMQTWILPRVHAYKHDQMIHSPIIKDQWYRCYRPTILVSST